MNTDTPWQDDIPAARGDIAGGGVFQRWWAECLSHIAAGENMTRPSAAQMKTVARAAWWAGWQAARMAELVELTAGIVREQVRDDVRRPVQPGDRD